MNPHHGAKNFDETIAHALQEAIRDGLCPEKYPKGKISETDDGAVGMAIAAHGDKVIVHFAGPCTWIGMGPEDAMLFAQGLIDNARHARLYIEEKGETDD